jgi:hypothetical protein
MPSTRVPEQVNHTVLLYLNARLVPLSNQMRVECTPLAGREGLVSATRGRPGLQRSCMDELVRVSNRGVETAEVLCPVGFGMGLCYTAPLVHYLHRGEMVIDYRMRRFFGYTSCRGSARGVWRVWRGYALI